VHREILRELDESPGPLTPTELSRRLIQAGVAYSQETKVNRVLTYIKQILRSMNEARLIEVAGQVPGKKYGTQNSYSLTPFGRMSVSLLLSSGKRNEQRLVNDVKQYLTVTCKKGVPLTDFPHDVMLEMINGGCPAPVIYNFALTAVFALNSMEGLHSFDSASLEVAWSSLIEQGRSEWKLAYAKAFLKTFRLLPEKTRFYLAMVEKFQRERKYLQTNPGLDFIRAIEENDGLIHIPLRCNSCMNDVLVKRAIDQIYERIITGERDQCPKCSQELVEPPYNRINQDFRLPKDAFVPSLLRVLNIVLGSKSNERRDSSENAQQ